MTTQILREIKFGNFESSKFATLVILEALNFNFRPLEIISHLKALMVTKIPKFSVTKIVKIAVFETQKLTN